MPRWVFPSLCNSENFKPSVKKMKRKVSDHISKFLRPIKSPLHRPHLPFPTSDSRFPITTPPKTTGIFSEKGDKFPNVDCKHRRPPRTGSDDAKTSEYAFFKKLKEDANHNKHHSCSKGKEEAHQGSSSKRGDISRERTDIVWNTSDSVRSSVLREDVTPNNYERSASRNTELKRPRPRATLEETENTSKSKGKGLDLFEEAETEHRHEDSFNRKRRKLLQWVRETSFPEIDDLCSNGSSMVSFLLSRLIPKSDGNNSVKNPKSMKVVPKDKSMPLPSLGSDFHFKELRLAPTESFIDPGCDRYFGDPIFSCWSKRSREMVSSSYSPTTEADKNHLDYTVWEPDYELLGRSEMLCLNTDSNSILPFEEYGSVTSGYAKESDIFHQPHEYMVGRQPCVPMLGWDFDRTDEKRNLSNLLRYRDDSELLGSSTMSCPVLDSDYVLPYSEHGLREPSYVKELGVLGQPKEYMVWKELCAPMLGWNFDSTDEERSISNLSRYRADSELLEEIAISCSLTLSDTDSVLPFKEHRLMASSHAEELDGFCKPNEYLVGREPCTQMLGWDFDAANEERNSFDFSRHTAEQCISNDHSHDVKRRCIEGKYDLQSDFHQTELPLTLSCIPTILNRARGFIDDRLWEGGTTFFSLQNDHWFRWKVINEGHPYLNAESLLQLSGVSREHYSSPCQALQFPREEISSQLLTYDDMKIRCLNDSLPERTLTHYIKDNVNIHDSSALCFQILLDRQKRLPLGFDLEKPRWDDNEREISFDDGDVNYIQSPSKYFRM